MYVNPYPVSIFHKDQMKDAMNRIRVVCEAIIKEGKDAGDEDMTCCSECPFVQYCAVIIFETETLPSEWKIR